MIFSALAIAKSGALLGPCQAVSDWLILPDASTTGLATMISDFDDAYSNAAYIPDGASYPARWARQAQEFRRNMPAGCRAETDMAYGELPRQKLDLFHPAAAPKGLAVFVHGGYWMSFAKSDWSHLAQGAVERGWAAALPGYTLAPEVRIADITLEIAAAIAHAAALVRGPIFLAGHSAGGHLVTRMICAEKLLPTSVQSRIAQVISISGVHDLRPLIKTKMNETLRLTQADAQSESPALLVPHAPAKVACVVGSAERPEFIRQSELLANIWTGLGADIRVMHATGRHHFDVIEDLASPETELSKLLAP